MKTHLLRRPIATTHLHLVGQFSATPYIYADPSFNHPIAKFPQNDHQPPKKLEIELVQAWLSDRPVQPTIQVS